MSAAVLSPMQSRIAVSYKQEVLSKSITSSNDAYKYLMDIWDNEMINLQEQVYAIYLNQNNQVIGWRCINTGTSNECKVDIKMVVACALLCMATGAIIAHNHPSGNIQPSKGDIFCTQRLKSAMDLLNITLLDHLIIGHNQHYSFVDNDKL
jgi:DNA repair protein RadC